MNRAVLFRFLLCLFLPALLSAEDRWTIIKNGPWELYSNASEKQARESLNQLEQLRYLVGLDLGRENLTSRWAIRIVAPKGQSAVLPAAAGRDCFMVEVPAGGAISADVLRSMTLLLIRENAPVLPRAIQEGLASLFSTLQVNGPKLTLGAPPPVAERTETWALLHLLATDPRYSGKFRVFMANWARGAEESQAYRNAFSVAPETLKAEAAAYLKAGNFPTVLISGKVIVMERDFFPKPLMNVEVSVARADLLLADPKRQQEAAQAYTAIANAQPERPEPYEGLGFISLAAKNEADARLMLTRAAEHKSKNARAWVELARLTADDAAAIEDLKKAVELDPHWAEPLVDWAAREKRPAAKLPMLLGAVKFEPSVNKNWVALAQAQEGAGKFEEAAKSWAFAENTAGTEEEKSALRAMRASADQQRYEQRQAALKKEIDEREADINRVHNESLARIHAAEAKANQQSAGEHGAVSNAEVVPWWDGPPADGKVSGTLQRVDCLSGKLRMVVLSGQKKVALVVMHPEKLNVTGKGQAEFACGVQQPAPQVTIAYVTKKNASLGTAGEVASIDVQ